MPKALIISELDSSNLGDQAIFEGLRDVLSKHGLSVAGLGLESAIWYEEGASAVPSASHFNVASIPLRKRFGRWLPRLLLEFARLLYVPVWYLRLRARIYRLTPQLATIDVVVFGGGGLLINNKWHFPLAVHLLCRILRTRGIPYGFSGIGASPGLDRLSIHLFAPCVNGASFVHTRDTRASELIGGYFKRANVTVGPDYALFCPSIIGIDHTRPTKRLHVGVNVMSASEVHFQPAAYNTTLELLRSFITDNSTHCRFTVYTTGYYEDSRAAREFIASLPRGIETPDLRDDFENAHELLTFCSQLNAVVTMRLHASLFAALANVPFVALAADNKVSAYLTELGLKRHTLSPLATSISVLNELLLDSNCFYPSLRGELRKLQAAVGPPIADILTAANAHKSARRVVILGTRGIPARYGGFETFTERLSLYLAQRGWKVMVFCQEQADKYNGPQISHWQGVERIHIPVKSSGAFGTIIFDWKATLLAYHENAIALTLGYNTAVFNAFFRLNGTRNLINMDGIEWRRDKWGPIARLWLRLNERVACRLADHLIADNPAIAKHLYDRGVGMKNISMIPYGADLVASASPELLRPFGLEPDGYALVVARPEPDNSILEIVQAFCAKPRHIRLVVLGKYSPATNSYHRRVLAAATNETIFPGAIYDIDTVAALRFHARLYIHGHKVGGTNPSLVEALGAGTPVLAHDNPFNRWVAGEAGRYFRGRIQLDALLTAILDDASTLNALKLAARARHQNSFQWDIILQQYEKLLTRHLN